MNDTPIVKAEQDQELVNQVAVDAGYLVFSGASDYVEEPELAQGEGKPRMHNPTLMFLKSLYHLLWNVALGG